MQEKNTNIDIVLIFTLKTRSRRVRIITLRGKENFLIE